MSVAEGNMSERLNNLLLYARKEIPFYADRLVGYTRLDALPFTTREDIKRNFPMRWIPAGKRISDFEGLMLVRSSGTTSERISFVRHLPSFQRRELSSYALNAGLAEIVEAGAYKDALLANQVCSGSECQIDSPLALSLEQRTTQDGRLSLLTPNDPFDFGPALLQRATEDLKAFQPDFVLGNPAYVTALARHLRRTGTSLPTLRIILSNFELLQTNQRRYIEATFGGRVYDSYGMSEAGTVAVECSFGNLHINEEWYVLESIPTNGRDTGTLVLTILDPQVCPLIRYATRDVGTIHRQVCDCTGLASPILTVHGREDELFTGVSGKCHTPRDLDRCLSAFPCILYFKLFVLPAGQFRLEIVLDDDANGLLDSKVKESLIDLTGPELEVARVSRLTVEASGKIKLVQALR